MLLVKWMKGGGRWWDRILGFYCRWIAEGMDEVGVRGGCKIRRNGISKIIGSNNLHGFRIPASPDQEYLTFPSVSLPLLTLHNKSAAIHSI